MDIPKSLTIVNGAIAMDGGSIFLEAVDDQSRRRRIMLDWSIGAQRQGRTGLSVDAVPLARGSAEESAWISTIARAEIVATTATEQEGERLSANRTVIAPDAKAILKAGESGASSGVAALRASLLEKLRS